MSGPCQLLPPLMYPPPCMKNITLSFSFGCRSSCRTNENNSDKFQTDLIRNFTHLVCRHSGINSLLRPKILRNWMWFVSISRQIRSHFEHRSTVQWVAVPKNGFDFDVFLCVQNCYEPMNILHEIVGAQWVALRTGCLGMRKICADPRVLLRCVQPNHHFLFAQLPVHRLHRRQLWLMVHSWLHQNFWPIVKWISTCTIATCFAFANSSTESKSVDWTGNTLYSKKLTRTL